MAMLNNQRLHHIILMINIYGLVYIYDSPMDVLCMIIIHHFFTRIHSYMIYYFKTLAMHRLHAIL